MKSLYGPDWDDLLNKMLNDLNGPLVDKLWRFNSKLSDAQGNCDLECRKKFVCGFKLDGTYGSVKC